jgi:sulfide dehydrogenase cytochrome subunit
VLVAERDRRPVSGEDHTRRRRARNTLRDPGSGFGIAGRLLRAFALPAAVCLLPLGAAAQEVSPAITLDSCANCHGPDLQSPGAIPSLDPANANLIAISLHAFKNGDIAGTIMNRIATGLTDAEIDALAKYLAAQRS